MHGNYTNQNFAINMNKSFIEYEKLEKYLLEPIISTNASLELLIQNRKSKDMGLIYTYFRDHDRKIKLGYSSNINIINHLLGEYKLVEKRFGSEREFKLLSITLNELGYIMNTKQFNYDFSPKLIKHLHLLGWPVGSLGRSFKKSY